MKRYIFTIIAAVCALSFTSCQKSEPWTPAESESGMEVYMYNTNSTSITLSSSETSFTIDFGRVKIGQAATISVSASGDTEYFTIPSSVSFGQYDEASSLTIT